MAFDSSIDKLTESEFVESLNTTLSNITNHRKIKNIHVTPEERRNWDSKAKGIPSEDSNEASLFSQEMRQKLIGIEVGANNYKHPNNFPSGEFRSVSVNKEGHVVAGSNPLFIDTTVKNSEALNNIKYNNFYFSDGSNIGNFKLNIPEASVSKLSAISLDYFEKKTLKKAFVFKDEKIDDDKRITIDRESGSATFWDGKTWRSFSVVPEGAVRLDKNGKIPKNLLDSSLVEDGVVGQIIPFFGECAPKGYVLLDGSRYSKSDLPELYEYAKKSGNLSKSSSEAYNYGKINGDEISVGNALNFKEVNEFFFEVPSFEFATPMMVDKKEELYKYNRNTNPPIIFSTITGSYSLGIHDEEFSGWNKDFFYNKNAYGSKYRDPAGDDDFQRYGTRPYFENIPLFEIPDFYYWGGDENIYSKSITREYRTGKAPANFYDDHRLLVQGVYTTRNADYYDARNIDSLIKNRAAFIKLRFSRSLPAYSEYRPNQLLVNYIMRAVKNIEDFPDRLVKRRENYIPPIKSIIIDKVNRRDMSTHDQTLLPEMIRSYLLGESFRERFSFDLSYLETKENFEMNFLLSNKVDESKLLGLSLDNKITDLWQLMESYKDIYFNGYQLLENMDWCNLNYVFADLYDLKVAYQNMPEGFKLVYSGDFESNKAFLRYFATSSPGNKKMIYIPFLEKENMEELYSIRDSCTNGNQIYIINAKKLNLIEADKLIYTIDLDRFKSAYDWCLDNKDKFITPTTK